MKSALGVNIKKDVAEKVEKAEPMAEEKMEDSGEFDKYELDNAVRTLHEAEEIKQNAALMKAIEPMLEKKSKAIKSLDDLRAVAKEKGASQNARIESY